MGCEAMLILGMFSAIAVSIAFPENDCLVLTALFYVLSSFGYMSYLAYAASDVFHCTVYLGILIVFIKTIYLNRNNC